MFLHTSIRLEEAIQNASHLFEENGLTTPKLDAEILLTHLLKVRKIDLYLDHLRYLSEEEAAGYESLVHRRLQGEPVSYITGEKEFWSLDFMVNRHCLIPRPETEILIERAREIFHTWKSSSHPYRILDIGTGCGAIAICLAREIPNAHITATDISLDTLTVAKKNAERHKVLEKIEFLRGKLFTPVIERKGYYDLIISNPPYIARRDLEMLPKEIGEYEPRIALSGGDDGLDFYRSIIPESIRYLTREGWLSLEVGFAEAQKVIEIVRESKGFEEITAKEDLSGIQRVVSAKKTDCF
jgi:release factor glutamine methyltransferase